MFQSESKINLNAKTIYGNIFDDNDNEIPRALPAINVIHC